MNRSARLAAALILAACTQASAAPPLLRISQDRTRKVCTGGQCHLETSTLWASGVIIGRIDRERVAALTCAHNWNRSAPLDVWTGPGNHRPARIIALTLDDSTDLALISFRHAGDIEAYALAERSPSAGSTLTAETYGGGTAASRQAECAGYFGRSTLIVRGTFRAGDSGGPLTHHGRLCGIISGNMGDHGAATAGGACRAFVREALGTIPGPPEETEAPPVPPPPPRETQPGPPRGGPAPTATPPLDLLDIIRRLDRIESRLDRLDRPAP